MKRITRNLFLILLIFFIPPAIAFGQEKKNEKKIMVIIDDGSGAKTVLDTVLTGTSLPETIELKDGSVILIGEPAIGLKHVTDGKKVIVSIEADANGEKRNDKPYKHIIIASSGDKPGEWEGEKTIIIEDGKVVKKEGEGFLIETDESNETTKYVIAKDGVVITVESKDEEKAKEIIKALENKIGAKNEDEGVKEASKPETKKTEKK